MAQNRFSSIIKENIKNYANQVVESEIGKVLTVGDGIVVASGLNDVMLNEIVEFENGSTGLVLNLEEETVSIICMGEFENITEGSDVKRTKKISSIQVGDEFLGRVVNALGEPIDGKGAIKTKHTSPIEKIAPGVMTRKSVNQPLETGILTVDSMFPIGKGQRELIIGDRQTGKSTVALDTIINQNGKDVYCVYVAIGQKASTVANVVRLLEETDSLKYTTIVNSSADDLPTLNYLAPFTGITLAEYWMSQGKDVLIVYDDLSKHAVAYRTLSLLLKRPPGREAYPGDVFYLHSRLLERACRVNEENGGGSITALPIIETQAGDISAYIPTNVISITDGQLFMQTDLFNAGQRPAIDIGLSVSRVGSSAQIKCVKQSASSLKLELASFFELQAFSQFGSDLDDATEKVLNHGERILAMIKQKQASPLNQIVETIVLFGIKEHFIDFIPVEKMDEFKEKLYFDIAKWKVITILTKTKEITPDISDCLKYEWKRLVKSFVSGIKGYTYPTGFSASNLEPSKEEELAVKKVK